MAIISRDDQIWIEGFTAALACAGNTTGAGGYKAGSESAETWWSGFKTAKNLFVREKIRKHLLTYRKAAL